MNRITKLFLLILLPTLSFAADKALLIGVGMYRNACPPNSRGSAEHPCVPNLAGIDLDVKNMHRAALSMGFPESQIHTLENERATLSAIEKELQGWFREGVGPKDRLLLYFSSHGSVSKGRDGVIGVLVPHDVAFTADGIAPVLSGPALSDFLEANPSRNIMLIVDACHSGRLTSAKGLISGAMPKVLIYPGMPDVDLSADLFHAGAPASKGIGEINFGYLSACTQKETAGATPNGSLLTLALEDSWGKLRRSHTTASLSSAQPLILQFIQTYPKYGSNDQHPEIEGDPRLLKTDWFSGSQSADGPPPPPPPSGGRKTKAWELLEQVAQASAGSLDVRLSSSQYMKNDLMSLSVNAGREGYLFVFSVGEGDEKPTVLLPNKWVQDNHVTRGSLTIPAQGANWHIRQGLPEGMSQQNVLLVVVLSNSPDSLKDMTSGTGPFKDLDLPQESTRSPFVEEAATPSGYLAGKALYVIQDKR